MSDYNKHKQRTAVRNLREYIKKVTEDKQLKTEINGNTGENFENAKMKLKGKDIKDTKSLDER